MSRILLKDNVTLCREDGSSVKFHIKAHIGSGASCVVYHAVCEDKTEHLLKEYYPRNLNLGRDEDATIIVPPHLQDKFNDGIERFRSGNERQKEVRLSENLKNFTSNVQGYFYGNGTEYIDMTVFAGRTYSKVENETLHNLMLRMRTLAQVIGYYHDEGLLHLDIKPDNIFVRPENETVEDVMLFDFDSVIEKSNKMTALVLSYTKDWAAPEQLLPYKRNSICEATDLFSIGEIIFTKIFGRHSTQAERRSFAEYDINYDADIFKNVNPKVIPLIKELFRHTLCAVPQRRYQTAGELIEQLDKIINLASPEVPFLKTSLPSLSGFFTGRDVEIQAIQEKFKETDTIFLSGIGGIGKSELAKHYAKTYESEYDAIIFAPFVNDVQMMITDDNYVPIYNFSQYPEEKPDEYFARKMRKLGELCDKRTLIIVDNLDAKDDDNLDKLFRLGCKMLVTTRSDFSDVYSNSQIDIDVLADPFSVFNEYYKKPLSEDDRKCVDEIIEIVCGHTMTVELLAKQMMVGRVKPEKMLEKLKEGGISDSGKEKVRTAKDGKLVIQSTSDHIQALFDLSELDEDEKYVLANLSLIPHTGISAELFCEWCEIEGFDTINNLTMEGWARYDKEKDYISLHPVVADVFGGKLRLCSCYSVLFTHFERYINRKNGNYYENVFGANTSAFVMALSSKLLKQANVFEDVTSEFCAVINQIGGVYFHKSMFNECEHAWITANKRYEELGDLRGCALTQCNLALLHDEIANQTQNKVMAYTAINEYKKALSYFKHAKNYDFLAVIYNNIGQSFFRIKEFGQAEYSYIKALELRKKNDPDDVYNNTMIGILYNNLGELHKDMGNHIKAIDFLVLGAEYLCKVNQCSIDLATVYFNMGEILSNKSNPHLNYDSALLYISKAKSIADTIIDENDLFMAQIKCVLGRIMVNDASKKNVQDGLTMLKSAKVVFERNLPLEHPDINEITLLISEIESKC